MHAAGFAPAIEAFRGFARDRERALLRRGIFEGIDDARDAPAIHGGRTPRSDVDHFRMGQSGRRSTKRKGPGNAGALSFSVSRLGLTATVAGAAATHPSIKPTHVISPVGTAHEEQLTELIP